MRISFLFPAFLTAALCGCSTLKKPFYYRVEGPTQERGYLFGTFHIGVPVDDLPRPILQQFEASNPVLFEVDSSSRERMSERARPFFAAIEEDLKKSQVIRAAQRDTSEVRASENSSPDLRINAASFENGETLKSRLLPAQWSYVVQTFGSQFGDESQIEKLHLETILLFLRQIRISPVGVTASKAYRLNPEWSLDDNLAQIANNQKKTIIELDADPTLSRSCQAELYLQQIQDLLANSPQERLKRTDRLEMAYRKGNLDELAEFVQEDNSPRLQDCLLNKRNQAWIEVIENHLHRSQVRPQAPFFAFGAAHLAGEKGIIKLLQARGYKVERVEF